MIDITGLDKVDVLIALYEGSQPQGMGFFHEYAPTGGKLSHDEAADMLDQTHYFDYVKGRVLKVSLEGDTFSEALYDRDNGQGAAAEVIAALRGRVHAHD